MIAEGEPSAVVRPLRRPGGLPPLFLVSAPGVNALGYVALARALSPRESPYSVEAEKGALVKRDYEPHEIEELARGYLRSVRARQPVGPYFFAGMCDGAHIAFEMAQRLHAEGEAVALLAMLDTWPVENSSIHALVVVESLRKRLLAQTGYERLRWLGRGARSLVRRAMSDGEPPQAPSIARWRARVWPGPSFVPPVLDGPITVIRARRQAYYRLRDATLGWGARSTEQVRVHVVRGDHERLLRKPCVDAVARALGEALEGARDRFGIPPARVEIRRLQ